ncbi:MAG: 6-phosphogluconolactonase, partial [bacterium]
GPDGHTASLFPGQDSLTETQRSCLSVRHPTTGQIRLTLTFPVLNAARHAVFLLSGAEKADVLAHALKGDPTLPAARVHPAGGEALWLVDKAASSSLH